MTTVTNKADQLYMAASDTSLPLRDRINTGSILRQIIANTSATGESANDLVNSLASAYGIKMSDSDKRALVFGIRSIRALDDRISVSATNHRVVEMAYAIGKISPSTMDLLQSVHLIFANGFITAERFAQYALQSTSPETGIVMECVVNGCRVAHNYMAEYYKAQDAKANGSTGTTGSTSTNTDSNAATGASANSGSASNTGTSIGGSDISTGNTSTGTGNTDSGKGDTLATGSDDNDPFASH